MSSQSRTDTSSPSRPSSSTTASVSQAPAASSPNSVPPDISTSVPPSPSVSSDPQPPSSSNNPSPSGSSGPGGSSDPPGPTVTPPVESSQPPSSNPGVSTPPPNPSSSNQPNPSGSVSNGGSDGAGGVSSNVPPNPSGGVSSGGGVASGSADAGSGGLSVVTVTKTDANGQIQTSVETLGADKKSNVGPIVGGVVGGVGGAIVIAALLWLLFRRRKRNYRDDFDDMMFDPARAQNHAPIDLADTDGAPQIDPYKYTPVEGIAATAAAHQDLHSDQQYNGYNAYGNQPQMAQAGYGPASVSATSESGGYLNAAGVGSGGMSRATSSSATSAGFAGRGSGYPGGAPSAFPMPMTSGPATTSSGPSADAPHMSAKQLEVHNERQRLAIQNQSPSAVTVHEDGGAFIEADASGSEVPPTYDSIPRK